MCLYKDCLCSINIILRQFSKPEPSSCLFLLNGDKVSPDDRFQCWHLHCRGKTFGKTSPPVGVTKLETPKPYLIADFNMQAEKAT